MVIIFWLLFELIFWLIWRYFDAQMKPHPFQNGCRLGPKCMQVGMWIWELFLNGSWHHFHWFFKITWHGRISKNRTKTYVFYAFAIFGCWAVGLTFWMILDRFWVDLEVENRSKVFFKSIQKAIENKMQVGMGFGWLLDWFWMDFGSKLGGKLGPSWH